MPTIKGKKGMGKRRKGMDKKRIYFALDDDGNKRRISRAEFDRRELMNLPVQISMVAVGVAATTAALGIIAGP